MSQAPYWPVATDALIADTMHLSTEEFGAYLRLMIAQWRSNGNPLPPDDDRLARMAGLSGRAWKRVRPILADFFSISDAGWSQKRVEKDFADIIGKIEKNRQNGSHGGKAKALKNKKAALANATNSPTDSPEQNASEPSTNHNQNHKEETSSLRSDVCAEPQAARTPETEPSSEPVFPKSPVFIAIPTNRYATTGEEIGITEAKITEYESAYPAVDVRQQLRQIRQWSIDKPAKRKTRRGMAAFVNGWLAREQDKGGNKTYENGRNGSYENGHKSNAHENFLLGAAIAGGVVPGRYARASQPADDENPAFEFGRLGSRAA